ncbi:MAG: hypothetical protein IJ538_02215 [Clostridia bacterium]|nr:hypothetical protein [Clostridia bacterium]
MKKLIIFLNFLIVINFVNYPIKNTNAESLTYAKALNNCTLYKTVNLSNDLTDIYFVIPETYFVVIIENVSDEVIKVQYDKFIGYVRAESVVVATFIPNVKTLLGVTFDIKETSGTQIWSYPSSVSGTILTTLSASTKKINYIAYAYGSVPNGGESNLWYFVSYTPEFNSTNYYEGYIYSENVTNLSPIIPNVESNPINETLIQNITSDDNVQKQPSQTFQTLLIIVIAVPIILLIAVILLKITKKIKENAVFKQNNKIENKYNSSKPLANNIKQFDSPIHNFEHKTFVRKNSVRSTDKGFSNSSYPSFPDYNSEDDWL